MKSLHKFYLAWALSSWGDRMWYFALSMYFIIINNNTLLITALNGFVVNLLAIFLGALIGSLIDKHQRIDVVRISLAVQNIAVGLTCFAVVFLLYFNEFSTTAWNGSFFYFVQGLMIFLNVIGNLSSMAIKTSVERDWVIVVAKNEFYGQSGEQEEEHLDSASTEEFNSKLASINSILRAINLITGILAPILAGFVMAFINIYSSFNGTIISAACFAFWNFISCFVEYFLMLTVYKEIPTLRKIINKSDSKGKSSNPITTIYKSWSTYYKQGALVLPGIAFSFLFLTVLSFDSITLGYAKSQKLTEIFISIFQGVGSLSGVLATVAFPIFHNKFKIFLPYIGWIGISFQLFFLYICFGAIWLPGSPFILGVNYLSTIDSNMNANLSCANYGYLNSTFERYFFEPSCNSYTSIMVLLGAMAISRFGLWLNDLSVNQIMQEGVDEKERGTVGGVQASLNTLFNLLKFALVISLSDISYYGFLAIISVGMTSLSFILFSIYAVRAAVKSKNNQVPLSEAGPFRKSMIEMVNNKNEQDDVDSFDSFYEGEGDSKVIKI